jgi:ferredoxin
VSRCRSAGPTVAIAEGCIACGWCSSLAGEVFSTDGPRAVVRRDSLDDQGRVLPRIAVDRAFLTFVADGCPAQVIQIGD